jgi:hypothetical protein
MKTTQNDTDAIHMPPDLLAEARRAANEEHRPADELVSDAVRRYLRERKLPASSSPKKSLAQFLMDSPLAGADLDLERRKEYPRSVEL